MGPNVRVIPNDKLYISEPNPVWFGNGPNKVDDPSWTNDNWLKSRFHFSFAEYQNFKNSQFGKLRVMNDDLVQPHTGFGAHGHSNMEILTYVVHGGLYHKDSMGTEETLSRGSIQFMTAGKGITHEEFNNESRPLRFIQTWILPRSHGLAPKYGSFSNTLELRRNTLQHLVSDVKNAASITPVKINQDIDTYVAELEMGKKVELSLADGRMAYALCIEGGIKINQKQLMKYDGCEITGSGGLLEIEATHVEETETGNVSHILIFVLPTEKGAGRTDI